MQLKTDERSADRRNAARPPRLPVAGRGIGRGGRRRRRGADRRDEALRCRPATTRTPAARCVRPAACPSSSSCKSAFAAASASRPARTTCCSRSAFSRARRSLDAARRRRLGRLRIELQRLRRRSARPARSAPLPLEEKTSRPHGPGDRQPANVPALSPDSEACQLCVDECVTRRLQRHRVHSRRHRGRCRRPARSKAAASSPRSCWPTSASAAASARRAATASTSPTKHLLDRIGHHHRRRRRQRRPPAHRLLPRSSRSKKPQPVSASNSRSRRPAETICRTS